MFMPRSKEAYIRYRIIDACLRNKHKPYPSLKEIIEVCTEKLGKAFSPSTIQKDFLAMRYDEELGFRAPIKYCSTNRGYHYTDKNYTISSIPLTDAEINALEFSLTILSQLSSVGIYDHIAGAINKITNTLSVRRILKDENAEKYIQIEKAPSQKGNEYLEPILEAIMYHKVLLITYKPFYADKVQDHIVHPYLLKEYRNRWYIIGFQEYDQMIKTFALDRFVSITDKPDINYRRNDIAPEIYYKNTIGITFFQGGPQEVILKFDREQAQYILTQPIHETQVIKDETKDHTIISLRVHPNYELQSIILGYGNAVEVLEPAKLRNQIKEMLDNTSQMYA